MSESLQSINIQLFSSITIAIAIVALGIFVFFKNKESWTNRLFAVLSTNIVLYIFANFLSLHPPAETAESQLFWIRIVMFITSFIGPTLLLLVHTFPRDKIVLSKKFLVPILILMTSSAVASLLPLVFTGISYPDGKPIPTPGPGMPIFFLDFVGLFLLSFIVLIVRYLSSHGIERKRMFILLAGIVLSFSLMGLTTVVFVAVLKSSDFVFFGPLSTIFLVASISYAIVRYKLFNARIVATEVFTLAMWATFSFNILTSNGTVQLIINTALLITLVIFGIFLIKGTRREIYELQRLSQAKSDFVSIVSHQMRTPLSAIKGFTSMILEKSGTEEDRQDWLRKISMTNERLIRLVGDILNVSRIEEGRITYNMKPVDISSLIDSVVSEISLTARDKKLSLLWQQPDFNIPQINADELKLRQVILNLLDNAIHYTSKGWVSIRLFYYSDLHAIKIIVQDTGIGIKKEDLSSIFGRFTRGEEGQKSNIEGAGIGLYVAKHIVLAHKGKIWAESEGPGTGSRFYVELPLE